MKDTFSFVKKWAYPWEVLKDEKTGRFFKNTDDPLVATDTAHLYFTANCHTNLQGGYTIKYSFANKKNDTLIITFYDGLPAHANVFYAFIIRDSFFVKPYTTYPTYVSGQKLSCQVTKQKLVLNKSTYSLSDLIMGYINIEFIEQLSIPNRMLQTKKYYLKGWLRAEVH